MSNGYNDAFDNKRFSGRVLKNAITEALSSLGPTWRDVIFEDMAKQGIDFEGETTYSVNDIRPYVYAIFEKDMGEILLEKLRKKLRDNE